MKKVKLIILISLSSLLLCLAGLIYYGYRRLSYTDDNYKWIDLRKTWPKGEWLEAKFVGTGYGMEWVGFEIPKEKLKEFAQQLKKEIKKSSKCAYIGISDSEQFRIITTEGRYCTKIMDGSDKIFGTCWRSYKMMTLLKEWGYGKSRHDGPVPSDPNFPKKLYPDPNRLPK